MGDVLPEKGQAFESLQEIIEMHDRRHTYLLAWEDVVFLPNLDVFGHSASMASAKARSINRTEMSFPPSSSASSSSEKKTSGRLLMSAVLVDDGRWSTATCSPSCLC